MTHEREPGGEHPEGPEYDEDLPNAWEIPVANGPDDLPAWTDPKDWDGG